LSRILLSRVGSRMRLLPRLLLAVSIPLVIVVVAVALVFASMSRVTAELGELRIHELASMQSEAGLHRAGWHLDVAMRHAAARCARDGAAGTRIAADVTGAARELEETLARSADAHPNLVRVSRDYLRLARRLETRPECALAASAGFQAHRSELDERLTNVWVARTDGLQDAVIVREAGVRELMTATSFGGLLLVGLAVTIALFVSLALARSVTAPLAVLTRTARRLGGGDLEAPVPAVGGAAELVEFGGELESMRGRLAELDSLKQGFIASCSHELRTPLSKMREALALLADGAAGELNARQHRVVSIARRACERQIRTVTSILDLSRLRAGTPLRSRSGVIVDGVLRAAVEQERAEADARGVEIRAQWDDDRRVRADLDDTLLEHAVANLVRNAVSVSDPGQVVRVHRTIRRGPEGQWLDVQITDEGPGVPEEIERSIFLPFVTHSPRTSPKRVGVGLGLALAREAAEAHGGHLRLVRADAGSVFELSIPLGAATRDVGAAPDGAAEGLRA